MVICKILTNFFIFALLINLSSSHNLANYSFAEVPGCPDFKSLNESIEGISQSLLLKLTCICGPSSYEAFNNLTSGVSINCIYGSTLGDLTNAIQMVNAANRSVNEISLNNLRTEDNQTTTFSDVFDSFDSSNLYKLGIKKCRNTPPNLDLALNHSLILPNMQSLAIEDCQLSSMPLDLLKAARQIKLISFTNNKIKFIKKKDLEMASQTLHHLDLSGNLISDVEIGSFSQLKKLKSLYLGEHNYASPQIKQEISLLPSLQVLDLTRMDGIGSNNDSKSLTWFNDSSIEKLKLTGCSLRVLNSTTFQQLTHLTQLDINANLLEKIEPNTFTATPMLKMLTLSSNFLISFPKDVWTGVSNLQHLDLADNEFTHLNATMLDGLKDSIEYLDLRHNERLNKLEKGVFDNFNSLKFLNISHCALQSIEKGAINAKNLKRLDLSHNNISLIEEGAFKTLRGSLESLSLYSNKLKSIDLSLLEGMDKIAQLDLADNPWTCDLRLYKVITWINQRYKWAASHSAKFTLLNPTTTVCHRPYSKQNMSVFELNEEDFEYQPDTDTTTQTSVTSTLESEIEENSTLDWRQQTIIVGGQEDIFANTSLAEDADAGKPTYDINSVKYGQRYSPNKSSNTWVSGVIVILLVIVTAISVICVAKQKKSQPALADTLTTKDHPRITTIF